MFGWTPIRSCPTTTMQLKAGGHKQNTLKNAWPISHQLQNLCDWFCMASVRFLWTKQPMFALFPSSYPNISCDKNKKNCIRLAIFICPPKKTTTTQVVAPNDGLSGIKYTIHLHDPWINIVSNGIPMFNSLPDFGSAAVFCPPLVQAGEGPA